MQTLHSAEIICKILKEKLGKWQIIWCFFNRNTDHFYWYFVPFVPFVLIYTQHIFVWIFIQPTHITNYKRSHWDCHFWLLIKCLCNWRNCKFPFTWKYSKWEGWILDFSFWHMEKFIFKNQWTRKSNLSNQLG